MRLNLGSGVPGPGGWTNINLLPGENIDFAIDMRDGLPFDDESVDYAVCHHVLDLLTSEEMRNLLDEVYQVLKLDGVLRVSCADLGRGVEAAIARNDSFFVEPKAFRASDDFDVEPTLGWFVTQGGARKQWLTAEGFEKAADHSGFRRVLVGGPSITLAGTEEITALDSREGESWFAEAQK